MWRETLFFFKISFIKDRNKLLGPTVCLKYQMSQGQMEESAIACQQTHTTGTSQFLIQQLKITAPLNDYYSSQQDYEHSSESINVT